MKFLTVDSAIAWAKTHKKHILVEIESIYHDDVIGILEVFPGGRSIFRGFNLGKVYERYRRKLTPDGEFDLSL